MFDRRDRVAIHLAPAFKTLKIMSNKTDFDPKRIERTIQRYRNDQGNIADVANNNRNEIGQLRRDIHNAQLRIDELESSNDELNKNWHTIQGKIDALEMVLNDEVPAEE